MDKQEFIDLVRIGKEGSIASDVIINYKPKEKNWIIMAGITTDRALGIGIGYNF